MKGMATTGSLLLRCPHINLRIIKCLFNGVGAASSRDLHSPSKIDSRLEAAPTIQDF